MTNQSKKIAIITSVCGTKETISEPSIVHKNVDYFAFVDYPESQNRIWNLLPAHQFSKDSKYAARRNAKIFKILPELFIPGYDYYFWVDASHDVIANPLEIISQYFYNQSVFGLFKHRERACVYEEGKILKKIGFDHNELITSQIKYFKKRGYPPKNGLFELSAFFKINTHQSTTASIRWWEIICKYSSRDQISLPFILWEFGITPSILPGFANGYNENGKIGNNRLMPQTRVHIPSGDL